MKRDIKPPQQREQLSQREDIVALNRIKSQVDGVQNMGGENGSYLDVIIKKRIDEILSLLNQRQGDF